MSRAYVLANRDHHGADKGTHLSVTRARAVDPRREQRRQRIVRSGEVVGSHTKRVVRRVDVEHNVAKKLDQAHEEEGKSAVVQDVSDSSTEEDPGELLTTSEMSYYSSSRNLLEIHR